jgi:hypothetical protein
MEAAIDDYLSQAVRAAATGNIEAEERALNNGHKAAQGYDGFLQVGTDYFEQRLASLMHSGRLRKTAYLGFAGDVHMFADRIVMYDQRLEVRRMDGQVRASVETAGELMVSQRPTLTRMMVGSVLPGTALIPGLAFQKQTVRDTRALFFVLEHPEWARMVQVHPDYEAALKPVAIAVNQASAQLAHERSQAAPELDARGQALDALRQLGELRDAGVLTEDEFEAKKAELLRQI